jgi:hypothetical protein
MKVIRNPAGQCHVPEAGHRREELPAQNGIWCYSSCSSGTITGFRANVCQVAPVLHQMKLALERAS